MICCFAASTGKATGHQAPDAVDVVGAGAKAQQVLVSWFSSSSNVNSDWPRSRTCRAVVSALPPGEACGINTVADRAATNSLRVWTFTFVVRVTSSPNNDKRSKRPATLPGHCTEQIRPRAVPPRNGEGM